MQQILCPSFPGLPPACMVQFPCRLTAAGGGRGFCMCHCAKRTARNGGRTARTTSRAKRTGTRAGIGQQVSGLCREPSLPLQERPPLLPTSGCCHFSMGVADGEAAKPPMSLLRCDDLRAGCWPAFPSGKEQANSSCSCFLLCCFPQELIAVPGAPCADPSPRSSPDPKICARRSGPTPTNTPQNAGAAGAASRCGLTPRRGTPTWLWPSTMPGGSDPLLPGCRT